jgi:hypothetical protein
MRVYPQNHLGNRQEPISPILVIVRACEDEPVQMEAVAVSPKSVTVRRPNGGGATVDFPSDTVYVFKVGNFRKLVKVFKNQDRDGLARLWLLTQHLT